MNESLKVILGFILGLCLIIMGFVAGWVALLYLSGWTGVAAFLLVVGGVSISTKSLGL